MTSDEITLESCKNLIEDLAYVQDEADALQYVIDAIPYDRESAEGYSVLDLLQFLDHLQVNYYRPLFDKVTDVQRDLSARPFPDDIVVSEGSDKRPGESDIHELLRDISKHRAALLTIVRTVSLLDWGRTVTVGDSISTLYEYTKVIQMRDNELLKEVANLIMAFQQDHQMLRQIQKRPGDQNTN